MAPRGPYPALLLPLVLLTVCLALASGQSCRDKNKKFRRNHVDFQRISQSKHNSYCNMRMKKMALYGTPIHTFIHAPAEAINFVCAGGGTSVPPGLWRSNRFFRATTCRYNNSHSYTGSYSRRQIVIGCCMRLAIYHNE